MSRERATWSVQSFEHSTHVWQIDGQTDGQPRSKGSTPCMRTVNPTTTCERIRLICINPERFTVHPTTAWWNFPSNSTRLSDRLYFTMKNPTPRRLAPLPWGILTPSDAMFSGPQWRESLCQTSRAGGIRGFCTTMRCINRHYLSIYLTI